MKKQDIVDAIVKKSGVKKLEVEKTLNAFFDFIPETLAKEGKLQISGIGTLKVYTRKNLVNPKTKKVIDDKEVKCVSFAQGQHVKDAINK